MPSDTSAIKSAKACPKCKNNDTDRIPRSGLIKALFPWLPLKHYACYRCGHKFYARTK